MLNGGQKQTSHLSCFYSLLYYLTEGCILFRVLLKTDICSASSGKRVNKFYY
jgi:hypothetical protein